MNGLWKGVRKKVGMKRKNLYSATQNSLTSSTNYMPHTTDKENKSIDKCKSQYQKAHTHKNREFATRL